MGAAVDRPPPPSTDGSLRLPVEVVVEKPVSDVGPCRQAMNSSIVAASSTGMSPWMLWPAFSKCTTRAEGR